MEEIRLQFNHHVIKPTDLKDGNGNFRATNHIVTMFCKSFITQFYYVHCSELTV